MKKSFYFKVLAVVICIVGIMACQLITTPIGNIIKNPREYDGKTVTVQGRVVNPVGLFTLKFFQIQDDTGTITVISEKPMAPEGSTIKVTGKVNAAFSFGDQTLVVIHEAGDK